MHICRVHTFAGEEVTGIVSIHIKETNQRNKLVKPFLKWAGGKSQLAGEIKKHVTPDFSTYYEPFLGGGAVLFYLQPHKAVVNDSSEELMNVYRVVKDRLEELIEDLKQHVNDADYFYDIRSWDRNEGEYKKLSPVKRASRLIYLNKTCYNGLYRVNKKGQFNVPFGKYKNPDIVNESVLRAVSNYLNKNEIYFYCGDFVDNLQNIEESAFVYFDPPYDPVSDSANFTSYNKNGFFKEEQERLKQVCDSLNEKGVKFLLSNSATNFIKDLYRDYKCEIIPARRAINSRGDKRGEVDELLVRNYE